MGSYQFKKAPTEISKVDLDKRIQTFIKPHTLNSKNTLQKTKHHQEKRKQSNIINSIPRKKTFNVENLWKIISEQLRLYLSSKTFKTWYKDVYLLNIDDGIAQFACTSEYKREWIENNNLSIIKKILLNITGRRFNITFSVKPIITTQKPIYSDNYQYYSPTTNSRASSINSELDSPLFQPPSIDDIRKKAFLSPNFTFNNFIVGSSNQLAHAVAKSIVENPGNTYNPVFIYGNTGVGKTHLMQAIGNQLLNNNSKYIINYCPIERFLNELIAAIRTQKNEEFRKKYRKVDLLILDDIQAISNFTKTQDEVFNTFNTLYLANKQIIIASDRPPKEINNLTSRLRSRFEGGMVVDMQAPDIETRIAIIQDKLTKAEMHNLNQDIISFIAENIRSNIRELEGAVNKIITLFRYTQIEPTVDSVKEILLKTIESKQRLITPNKVIKCVCNEFAVNKKEILGKSRLAHIALARQTVMFLLREELELSLQKIASIVNRKDHTTIMHGCEKVKKLLDNDKLFRDKLERSRKNLLSS